MKTNYIIKIALCVLLLAASCFGAIKAYEANHQIKSSLLFEKTEAEACSERFWEWWDRKDYVVLTYHCTIYDLHDTGETVDGLVYTHTGGATYEGHYHQCISVEKGTGNEAHCRGLNANEECHKPGTQH